MNKFLKRAKKIIAEILYITIATTSKDGQPWNSPVYSAFDQEYNFFWISSPNSQHSRNIKENSRVALVIYDSSVAEGTGEGVYIQAKADELSNESEITHALKYIYGRIGKSPRLASEYLNQNPRRVYKAIPERFWMNTDEKINGHHVDKRVEIKII